MLVHMMYILLYRRVTVMRSHCPTLTPIPPTPSREQLATTTQSISLRPSVGLSTSEPRLEVSQFYVIFFCMFLWNGFSLM